MGESLERRAELAAQLGELGPYEVPLNSLTPRPGTPFGDLPMMDSRDALRTIAAFRQSMPAADEGAGDSDRGSATCSRHGLTHSADGLA